MNLGSKGESLAGNNQDQHDRLKRLFEGISNLNKPVIAVINGPCYGGGNGLAMVCDIRIASHPGVTFNLSEVTIGVAPALISKYLVREWGAAKAREAMLTARAIPAAELLTVGGVHHVAEDAAAAHAYADALVARFVGNAPGAMAAVKQLTNTMATEAEGEQDAAIARMFLDMMRPSLEAKYGIDMFRAKQKADWSSLYARQ
ncbi:ClpP/crotonase [Calocera viscosa TUFC12733]|uniref:ClpP/crotonase n=1 Tax=Calocera viscosa (strain TUFC12733) TaxID=1330018 RepID=A0A167HBJ1_CALVF|nr:ClpP/crotonase [Calocera viscosa TUFC12733]